MKKIWLMALIVLVTGCATQKRKENRARNYYLDNKEKLAELSSTVFPVTDGFKKGERIIMPSDTVRSKGIEVREVNRMNDWSRIVSPIDGWVNNKFFK